MAKCNQLTPLPFKWLRRVSAANINNLKPLEKYVSRGLGARAPWLPKAVASRYIATAILELSC